MQLGALVPRKTPHDIVAEIARLGLTAAGSPLPADLPPAEIRATFREASVQLAQVGCYTNLECAAGSSRDTARATLRDTIAAAGMAGARSVVSGVGHMDPDCPTEVFAAHQDNWTDEAMGRLVESCAEAAEWARAAGTTFCVETWVITTLNTPQRVGELVRKVGTNGFGILLDPVNLMCLDTYFDNARLIDECFDTFGDAITLVHAKDTKLLPSPFTYHMSEAPPGEGILDYATLLRRIDALPDPTTPLLIEHLAEDRQIERARDHIRNVADAVSIRFDTVRQEN